MTEIARFAENSLFCPFAPFFSETQTTQKGRKKKTKWENRGGNFAGLKVIGCHKNLSESLGINPS